MSDADGEVGVGLSEMIEQLRLELGAALGAGDGKGLRFIAESVELELNVSVAREGKGKAGIKFWVVDAGLEGGVKRAREQTIKLKLSPRDVSGPGGEAPGKDGKAGRAVLISESSSESR